MARRALGGTLAVASALLGVPPTHADTQAPPLLPLTSCDTRVNDITEDGTPRLSVQNFEKYGEYPDPRGSVPGLDITGVTFRVTATRVYAFLSLKDIPEQSAMRATDSAYGYRMWFSVGPRVARFETVYVNQTHYEHGLAPTQGDPVVQTASVGDNDTGGPEPLANVAGGIDTTKDVAWVAADRASLEQQVGQPLADGDQLTAIHAKTYLWETNGQVAGGVFQRPADQTDAEPAAAVQKVGDNRCFPVSPLTVRGASVQYGDAVTLTATLTDAGGAPLAAKRVTFTVPGESAPRTLTTDAAGGVSVTLAAAPAAGTYPLTVRYQGDDYTGDGLGHGTLTVKPETIRMTPPKVTRSGSARSVTTTLTEDDPRAFAKQPVDWYVNGKKVATVLTDATGRSVFKAALPGQKVQARYAGAAGRYAAVKSAIVTA